MKQPNTNTILTCRTKPNLVLPQWNQVETFSTSTFSFFQPKETNSSYQHETFFTSYHRTEEGSQISVFRTFSFCSVTKATHLSNTALVVMVATLSRMVKFF